jgi:hypothetical protein
MGAQSPQADGPAILCWLPRAVLGERFYRSRSHHEAGETARTLHHNQTIRPQLAASSNGPSLPCRRPPLVHDSEERNSKIPSSVHHSIVADLSSPSPLPSKYEAIPKTRVKGEIQSLRIRVLASLVDG